jgi:hypothetical protein
MTAACRRCQTPLEAADLRCSICALSVPREAHASGAPRASILRCRECAAAVSYSAEAQAPSCAFCGSVMQVEQPEDPVETAEWLVPFSIDHQAAAGAVRTWLGNRGWFRPKDLSSAAAIEHMRPLHWSAWVFDADATVSWTADSDFDSGRSSWAPHAGSTTFSWRGILIPASRGLTSAETERLTPRYTMDRAVPIAQAGAPLEGSAVEAFDVQRSAARQRIVAAIEAMATDDVQRGGFIPGGRYRNVHTSVLLSRLVTRRMVLPAWVTAYRYGGTVYRTIVHGQDDRVVLGEAPVSGAKVLLVIIAAVVAVLLALLILGAVR